MLDGKLVGGVDASEVATGDDEFVVRVEAEGPVFLKTACVVGGDGDRCGEFKKTRAGK